MTGRHVKYARTLTPLRSIAIFVAAFMLFGLYVTWPVSQSGLVIYSSVGSAQIVATEFTKETGIRTTVIPLSTGPLLARISAEAHHPRWSVAWFEGDGAAAALDQMHLLQRGPTPDLDWTPFGQTMQPRNGAYIVTGYTLAGVFLSRASRGQQPAAAWPDLIAQERTRLGNQKPCADDVCSLGIADPALSGPAYPMLAGLLATCGGWPQGQGLVRQALATGMRLFPSNPSVVLALRSRELEIAVVQSSAAYALVAKDPSFRVQVPRPAAVLPSVVMIAADTDATHRTMARRFETFLMQPRIQTLRLHQGSTDHLFWPVTRDVVQTELPTLDPTEVKHLDPAIWGPQQNAIISWFEREVARQ